MRLAYVYGGLTSGSWNIWPLVFSSEKDETSNEEVSIWNFKEIRRAMQKKLETRSNCDVSTV